eukprot:831791-Pelagomonas_calceolata.AAC.1
MRADDSQNLAYRNIMRAVSRGPLRACPASMDVGSPDFLALEEIPHSKQRLTSSHSDTIQGVYNGGLQPETLADGS